MIISDLHKYVYIGIPRTGSKSMNHWLCEYFDGRSVGGDHDYKVPREAAGFLVFTIVRNPYDRATSGHFGATWDDQGVKDNELEGCRDTQERLRRIRTILKSREKQVRKEMPAQSSIPLADRIREANARNETDGHAVNQKRFVERAGVQLVLYFERLPECLRKLHFVDPSNVPPFPHHPERGTRPSGTFFDFFRNTDEEQVVWAGAAEDFAAFGYGRFDPGLPEDLPDALPMR